MGNKNMPTQGGSASGGKKAKKLIKIMILTILGAIGLVLIFALVYMFTAPQMGGKTAGFDSANFRDGKFQNLVPTPMMSEDYSFFGSIYEYYFKGSDEKYPSKTLPTVKLDSSAEGITWLGHSTVLIKTEDLTIITDPVLSGKNIPPLGLGPKPFPYENTYQVEDLPKINVVLISHDHFDHLDMETVRKLQDAKFYVPLGVGAHLRKWGIAQENIKELDWNDQESYSDNLELVFTPARHFGGRNPLRKDKTLWGSWVIKLEDKNLYFGGDSGYFEEFKKIGKEHGPFDLAMLDVGQYDKSWQPVHFLPEEAVQAAIDLRAKALLPIHNMKYVLAYHSWHEPLDRVLAESEKREVALATPMIGKTFSLNPEIPQDRWWKDIR